jgi:hypothetical protein
VKGERQTKSDKLLKGEQLDRQLTCSSAVQMIMIGGNTWTSGQGQLTTASVLFALPYSLVMEMNRLLQLFRQCLLGRACSTLLDRSLGGKQKGDLQMTRSMSSSAFLD